LSETGGPSLLNASLNVKGNSGHRWRSRSESPQHPQQRVPVAYRGSRRCAHPKRDEGAPGQLAKCDSEQARAEQHKAGYGYCEESVGHEVMITHGTPRSAGHRLNAPRPLEQNDMPRSAVKRISRCSENWNLTDALEQQRIKKRPQRWGAEAAIAGVSGRLTRFQNAQP
jgi:uncharacterized low-complexity protein